MSKLNKTVKKIDDYVYNNKNNKIIYNKNEDEIVKFDCYLYCGFYTGVNYFDDRVSGCVGEWKHKTLMSKEEIAKCINDNGYGLKEMNNAEIVIYAKYIGCNGFVGKLMKKIKEFTFNKTECVNVKLGC